MNYSPRKHMERIMAAAPEPADPFGRGSFAGLRIVESPDRPRYTLPAEVIPGVPWPSGFREEFNRWSVGFLGTVNVLPAGTMYVMAGGYAVMRPKEAAMLINCAT